MPDKDDDHDDSTPRIDRLERIVAGAPDAGQLTEALKVELELEAGNPDPQTDSRDIPDADGVTPRQRWINLCNEVAERDGITPDEANRRLLQLPEFGGPVAGQV